MKLTISAAVLVWALPATAAAETPTLQAAIGGPADLKVSGSVRLRYETLDGQPRAGVRADLSPAGIYNAIGRANIETVGVRAEIAPSARWDAFAAYRPMWLAEKTAAFSTIGVRDVTGASGRIGGHQLEVRVRYWLVPSLLRAEINALWLAKGRFLETAPNAPARGDTHYLATALTATF